MAQSQAGQYRTELRAEVERLLLDAHGDFEGAMTAPLSDGRQWVVMPADQYQRSIERKAKTGARHLLEALIGVCDSIAWTPDDPAAFRTEAAREMAALAQRIAHLASTPQLAAAIGDTDEPVFRDQPERQ